MSQIAELTQQLTRVNKRMDDMNAEIVRLSSANSAARGDGPVELIRKALMSSGNSRSAATIGFDGEDTLGLLRYIGQGTVSKALGWGPYLEDIHAAAGGRGHIKIEAARDRIDKVWKCKPVEKTALAEDSGNTGGYTVPVQFYAELLREVAEASWLRSRCTTLPMASRTMLIPALNQKTAVTKSSAYFGGIAASFQSSEGDTFAESEPVFRQIELVARDLVFHCIASNQLLQDNAVALDTLLTTLFKEAMTWFIEYYILRGTGVNEPRGIIGAPCTINPTRVASNNFRLLDAANMLSRLLVNSWDKAVWAMNPSVMPQLITMADSTNGRLVWLNQMPDTTSGGGLAHKIPMTLLGLPIFWTEKLPYLGTTGDVCLMDLSKCVVGDRLALQIDVSPHVKFIQNQMVWRVIQRFDSKPWLDGAIPLNDGTHTVSPFVALSATQT